MLNSVLIAHRDRWQLPRLTWEVVRGYMHDTLMRTLERLHADPQADPYFLRLALFHEDMHAEALLMSLQTLGLPAPELPRAAARSRVAPVARGFVEFEGGRFVMGSRPGRDFVFDNELDAHEVTVAPFALARTAVTQGEYLAFVGAGGYGDARWWTEEGWRWRQAAELQHPRDWRRTDGQWLVRRFASWEKLEPEVALVHVGAYEAEAYAAFAMARLPTEAEWEFAARAGREIAADRFPWGAGAPRPELANLDSRHGEPLTVDAFADGDSAHGLRQMLGNVWEWTSSAFLPYPGFTPGPYREYSQPWFGDHRVLRGGSFATRGRLVHNRWRNFYTPDRNDVFAGIRPARGSSPSVTSKGGT
jgi:iron(II)-dependent oxidoreductase